MDHFFWRRPVGHDVMRDGLRTFAIQRIKGLSVLKSTFERPKDFQIGQHLGGSIGIWDHNESEPVEVVIEVTGWMARIVQERLWHPTQTTRAIDDLGEKIELRMQLGNLKEVKHLVLSWGVCAKVIKPMVLRDAVKKEAAAVARSYKG